MSHSVTERSHLTHDRFSWSTLPSTQGDEESSVTGRTIQGEQRSPSPVSRPESRSQDYHEPTSNDAAPTPSRTLSERSGLLHAHHESSSHQAGSSITNIISNEKDDYLSDVKSVASSTWLPYTLRKPFLVFLGLVSLALSTALAVLCWYSAHHRGLQEDDGSTRQLVEWRYMPTIIAVLFTQALVIIAEDVKRTEAFARMARPMPIEARYTLLYRPKVWWKSLFEGLSRKRSGGRRSWLLTFSSLIAGLSILVVSTFSSSIFTARDVLSKDAVQLQRFVPAQNGTVSLQSRRATYSRTISGFLYNTSTSLWVSDSHIIFPFAPVSRNATYLSFQDGTWEADTKVLQMDSVCVPAPMIERTTTNVSFSYAGDPSCNDSCTSRSKGFKVRSADGCEVQVQSPIAIDTGHKNGSYFETSPDNYLEDRFMKGGGVYWTNMSLAYESWQDLVRNQGRTPRLGTFGDGALAQWSRTFIYDLSVQCRGRDMVLVTPPWSASTTPMGTERSAWQDQYWRNFTVRAEVCTPTIYEATLPVTVSMGRAGARASFNSLEFSRRRKPISLTFLDRIRLDNLTFGAVWQKYMTAKHGIRLGPEGSDVYTEGVALLLSKAFQNSTNMLSNSTLAAEASKLRARFLYELLLSSTAEADLPEKEDITGYNISTQRRIVVVQEVAITLAILFLLATCYLWVAVWGASTARRPLHLRTDPATIVGTASLVEYESSLASKLRSLGSGNRKVIQHDLGSRSYAWQNNTLVDTTPEGRRDSTMNTGDSGGAKRSWLRCVRSTNKDSGDWRPHMLYKTWLIMLLIVLVAVATALLVLRRYAIKQKLYRTAFVYQVDLGFFKTSIAPHSVIATLIAVAVGLSWDGIDKPMRTLQPYLGMSHRSSDAPRSITLSYQSSFWAWAAVKAARYRHWILCLVAIGTTLSQILIISMAAIFERQAVMQTRSTQEMKENMNQTLTLRQEPFSFSYGQNWRPWSLDDSLLLTSQTDWIYRALDEITLGSPTPPWTLDGWIFTPVNMDSIPDAAVPQDRNAANSVASAVTISLNTSALRSRIDCSTVSVPVSGWLDRAEDVFSNRTNEAVTGYVLPALLFKDTPFSTPVFTAPRRMACCTNGTAKGQQSVIAYWSSNSTLVEKQPQQPVTPAEAAELKIPRAWFQNFTIKWIVGPTSSVVISGASPPAALNNIDPNIGYANETLLYFTDPPEITALNCVPIIEQANASVTVARSSGHIIGADFLSEPQHVAAAWEYAYDAKYDKPWRNSTTNSTSGYDENGMYWSKTTFDTTVGHMSGNVSYGVFFTSQLLTAPHIIVPPKSSSWLVSNRSLEDLDSERFSIRDKDKGLNMDFMSYANLHKVNHDARALLNASELLRHSEETFQTFFKHFAVSGRWEYGSNKKKRTVFDEKSRWYTSDIQINGTISQRIEVLAMNETATWLSLSIIGILVVIIITLIVSMQIVYPKSSMQYRVECLADVLSMVAGSEELRKMIREKGVEGMKDSAVQTRLGWFRDTTGVVRWGVEVADGSVEWLDGREKSANELEATAERKSELARFPSWGSFWSFRRKS